MAAERRAKRSVKNRWPPFFSSHSAASACDDHHQAKSRTSRMSLSWRMASRLDAGEGWAQDVSSAATAASGSGELAATEFIGDECPEFTGLAALGMAASTRRRLSPPGVCPMPREWSDDR